MWTEAGKGLLERLIRTKRTKQGITNNNMKILMMVAMVALVAKMTAFAGVGTALVGRPLGRAVEKALARELAEEAAEAGVKAVAMRTMSSALAGLSAKTAIGIGVGVGTAAALPVAAHELSDGVQEEAKARAEAIRKTSDAAAKVIPEHPELVGETYGKMNEGAQSGFGGIEKKVWNLVHLIAWGIGIVAALYLGGALIKAFGFVRREVKMAFVPLPVPSPGPQQRPQERVQGCEGCVLQ